MPHINSLNELGENTDGFHSPGYSHVYFHVKILLKILANYQVICVLSLSPALEISCGDHMNSTGFVSNKTVSF